MKQARYLNDPYHQIRQFLILIFECQALILILALNETLN